MGFQALVLNKVSKQHKLLITVNDSLIVFTGTGGSSGGGGSAGAVAGGVIGGLLAVVVIIIIVIVVLLYLRYVSSYNQ